MKNKYEYTRKEIIEWLREQNWKCPYLEEIILKVSKGGQHIS